MKKYTIYLVTNIINNKKYIGYTSKTLNIRKNQHICQSNRNSQHILHKAIRKYGINNFIWEILYESFDKNHTLKTMENFFIIEHNTFVPNGYNLTMGGQGGIMKLVSEETRKKQSLAKLGKKRKKESIQKQREKRIGIPLSLEHRKKLSEIAKNRTPEHLKKIADANRGKIMSLESRLKMSLSKTGKSRKKKNESVASAA